LRVLRQILGQEFERDETAKLGVLGFVDHTHAADSNLPMKEQRSTDRLSRTSPAMTLHFSRKPPTLIATFLL
jgi:hypothetical protein